VPAIPMPAIELWAASAATRAARCLWLVAASTALALAPAPASAQTMHRSPHMEETANIVGLKGGVVNSFNKEGHAVGGGFSLFYERNMIPGWLEIEAASSAAWIENETVIELDVFAKKPFHANEVVNPYLGLGPNVSIIIAPQETRTRFGIHATAGSYFWFGGDAWALDVEVLYLMLFGDNLTHDFTVEVGPAFRF